MKLPDINNKPAVAAYLSAALAKADTDKFMDALAEIVHAHGVAAVARDAGLSRDTIYKLLRKERNPLHETVVAILEALGLRLAAEVITTR
jgi:probable addiction module antidote protein